MDFMTTVKERFSVRKYQDKPIEAEKMDKILEAGRLCPTAKNMQPQRFYVIESAEAMEKLKTATPCTFGAPAAILVCADMDAAWYSPDSLQPGYNSAEMDCSIAATHMMLAAWDMGIGSCWVRWFNAEKMAEALDLPANIKPICLLDMGYATEDCEPRHDMHDFRMPIEEMATRL